MNIVETNEEKEKVIEQLFSIMYYYSNKGDYRGALNIALEIYKIAPSNVQLLSDIMTYHIYLRNWIEAIKFGLLCITLDENVMNAYDGLSHAFGELQDWEQAGKYGRIALELRDSVNQALHPNPPRLSKKPQIVGKQNLISFSLYGNKSAYIETAVLNSQLVHDYYPNWICRFYIDESVPSKAVDRLRSNGAEIIYATKKMKRLPATMWRFLAMEDSNVGYIIFRDADAVISKRESSAVQEWIESHQRFHTIRDSGSHTELVLAGLWGAMAHSIPNFCKKMYRYVEKGNLDSRFADQFFLRDYIWQYIRQDVYASDSIFDFCNAHPITTEGRNYDIMHIGCDEGDFYFRIKDVGYENGEVVTWKFYTQISPKLNDDLSPHYVAEYLLCEYDGIVEDNSVGIYIPRRYGIGLKTGQSRIELNKKVMS